MSRAAIRGPLPASPAPSPVSPVLKSPNLSLSFPSSSSSSPLMSLSAAQSHVASNNALPPSSSSQASPPSSAPMSSQLSQQPPASFPTPASSVMGNGDLEPMDKSAAASVLPADRAHLGRRSLGGDTDADDDAMDVDKVESGLGLDTLQKDFVSAYHLCKRSYVTSGPDPSIDLISLYGLGPVAKSVARIDPITGEKINRLRKSYEGKLKPLGLAGRNKPLKQDPSTGGLRHLTLWPDEEWQNQKVYGKELKAVNLDARLQQLQQAMKMEPGTVPNNDYWEDVLGHEKPPKHGHGPTASDVSGKKASLSSSFRQNGTPTPTTPAAEPERTRPSRGRKRHYDENSFVGYGEGYADDDEDDGGSFYSNSESIGKKKRKKV